MLVERLFFTGFVLCFCFFFRGAFYVCSMFFCFFVGGGFNGYLKFSRVLNG